MGMIPLWRYNLYRNMIVNSTSEQVRGGVFILYGHGNSPSLPIEVQVEI